MEENIPLTAWEGFLSTQSPPCSPSWMGFFCRPSPDSLSGVESRAWHPFMGWGGGRQGIKPASCPGQKVPFPLKCHIPTAGK